jgi:multidrug resistance protein, MATE family
VRDQLKATFRLALPVIIGQLGQIFMGVTDSVMVGRLGAVELAASSFVLNIFSLAFVVLIGISTGISAKVSQSLGADKKFDCGAYLMNGLLITFVAIVFIIMALFSLAPFLEIFKQPEAVTLAAKPFYILMVWGFFPLFLFFSYKQFLDGLGRTVPAMMITFIGVTINIILNYLFIFGHGGFPKMGLVGSGLATLVSRILMALIMWWYVQFSGRFKIFLATFNLKFSGLKIRHVLEIGVPSACQYLFEVIAFSGAGILMGWISLESLAAHQIAINLASITFMVAVGISIASSVRVGRAFGAKNFVEVRQIGMGSLGLIVAIESVFAVTFILCRNFFPTIYIDNPRVIDIASQLLIVAGFFQIFDGTQSVCVGILRGMSDVKVPTLISLGSYWIVGLGLAYVLAFPFHYAELGIWIALALSLLVASSLLVMRFRYLLRQKLATSDI